MRRADAADVGVALRVDLTRKRVARVAQDCSRPARPAAAVRAAAARDAAPASRSCVDDRRHRRGVRNRRIGKRPARRLGRIDARLAVHVVEALGALVVRRQRVVVDRPRRRDAVDVLDAPGSPRAAADRARCPRTWCCRRRSSACTAETRGRAASSQRSRRPVAQCFHTASGFQFSASCGTKSPRSRIRIRAPVSASACAIVPPPAPLPMMMMS